MNKQQLLESLLNNADHASTGSDGDFVPDLGSCTECAIELLDPEAFKRFMNALGSPVGYDEAVDSPSSRLALWGRQSPAAHADPENASRFARHSIAAAVQEMPEAHAPLLATRDAVIRFLLAGHSPALAQIQVPEKDTLILEIDDEHPDFPRAEWKAEVAADDTKRSYWEWVHANLESAVFDAQREAQYYCQAVEPPIGFGAPKSSGADEDEGPQL